MVLLSASICTKTGKALVGRQFMEISRSRIEGLLAAFPKLIKADGQHTFVETDNVRYVYQPLDSLYMVLVTTKNSNILEDLETLRLFARVVPEYCMELNEAAVSDAAFELIFAFDEIVALGYRESVNLSQIRTFIEMDSHDENIAIMVKRNKENEQKEVAKRRAKELKDMKRHRLGVGMGGSSGGTSGGQFDSGMGDTISNRIGGPIGVANNASLGTSPSISAPGSTRPKKNGMRLGKKGKKDNDFVEQLMAEGQVVRDEVGGDESVSIHTSRISESRDSVPRDGVHLTVAEKISVEASRDGGIEGLEVKGIINMLVSDPLLANVKVKLAMNNNRKIPFQTHPNVDKKLFKESVIGLKSGKPFPVGVEVGIVKWRFQSSDEDDVPFTINCWPTVNNDGSADVNVDYELVNKDLVLEDVAILVPVSSNPVVGSIDGDYNYDRREGLLEWSIVQISDDNDEGSLEFSVKNVASIDDFFPVRVMFNCKSTFAAIDIAGVEGVESGGDVTFSQEICLSADSYEYV